MTTIHDLKVFTADNAESGPGSVLVLEGFDGSKDLQAFLTKLLEPEQPEDDVMWPASIVFPYVGLSDTTVRKKVHKGEFPAPIDLGDRRKAWVSSEVIAWRMTRPRRWIGEVRKPVALRKIKPGPSTRRGAGATAPIGPTIENAEVGSSATA